MKVITVLVLLPLAAVSLTGQSRPSPRVPGPSVGMLPAPTRVRSRLLETYGRLPLAFEANQGQTAPQVKFVSRGAGYNLFLTATEAVLAVQKVCRQESNAPAATALPPQEEKSAVLHMKLLGGNAKADVFGQDELPGKSNYFMGNDPKKWHAGVRQYGKVRYAKVYPGVDLVYYGNQREIEYDFVVAPGADPRRIQFDMGGARRIRQNEEGDLVLTVGEGEIRWHKPIVYQEKDGTKQLVIGHYVIRDKTRVSFEVGKYDAARPLYIDPLLYSSYLGGRKFDQGTAIALDSAGNAYVTGYTESNDFPTMNPEQPKTAGGIDAFVVKMNPSGSAMVYATYLGGTLEDTGDGIAVDNAGNAYVTGFTQSTNFPTKNPLQPNLAGQFDIYVAKLDPTGSSLVYSTYLGGTDQEQSASIAVNSAGFAFVTGQTWSVDFPTTPGAFQTVCKFNIRCVDAFVSKINPSGSALVYSTLLGGKETDLAGRIAVDSADNVYLTGYTESDDFPTMNPLQPSFGGGGSDAFVAKLNPAGSALVYSTYLGGTGNDLGTGIAVDNSGNVYVAGATSSTDFPTANALQPSSNGDFDAFVAKINAAGSALVYSTYLGGTGSDFGVGIAADSSGNAYVAGTTGSNDFPTESSLQPYGHNFDAFVTKITPSGSSLVYSTYLGGSKYDNTAAIALENSGNVYIVGQTQSNNFPGTPAFTYRGQFDAFVAKINIAPETTTTQLVSSVNPSVFGKSVTFTATVSSSGGTPTGTVTFRNGTTVLGTRTLSGGVASFTTSKLPTGSNNITAAYGSDPNFSSSTSAPVVQLVLIATTTALTSAPNPSVVGQMVTFTATVNSSFGAPPDGETVTFKKGTTVLGTRSVNGGVASFATSTLRVGTTAVKAVYGGDSTFAGSTSNTVKQVVTAAN